MQLIDAIYSDVEQRSATMTAGITIGKIIAEISQYLNHCKFSFSFSLFIVLFFSSLVQHRTFFSMHLPVEFFVMNYVDYSVVIVGPFSILQHQKRVNEQNV